jgi:predicted PurR-regulated permease PerM
MLPLVRRVERRGLPRGAAVAVVFAGFLAIVAGFGLLIVPPLVSQTERLIDQAPEYVDNFDRILDRYPGVRDRVDEFLGTGEGESTTSSEEGEGGGPSVDPAAVQEGATAVISIGANIVGGIANAFFVIILALYLLVEGERTWKYFARYMTPTLRYRFHRLGPQLTQVVSGYVLGQSIISSAFGIYSYVVLLVLEVPQPLLLALFGAIAVAIPIVGVPIATVAAMAIAVSVDLQTSLIVLAAFTAYQMFENYILVPRVYGNTLQVTSLSILVGVLVGGQLMGILGIVLSLPITASIPVIERIWREEIPDSVEAQEAKIAEASG